MRSDCLPTVIRQKKNGGKSTLTVKILRFSTENRLHRGWKSAVPTPETCYFTQNSRQESRGGNVKIRGIVNGCTHVLSATPPRKSVQNGGTKRSKWGLNEIYHLFERFFATRCEVFRVILQQIYQKQKSYHMMKKTYFQPKTIQILLENDYICNLQQGSGEFDSSMDIDAKQRTETTEEPTTEWGQLW